MQPHATRRSVTDCDGRFSIEVPDRSYGLLAMDAERRRGSLVLIPYPYDGEKVQMQLAPLVKVHGRMEFVVGHRTIDWSHVFVELAPDPQQPLARRRIVSCGSFERRSSFDCRRATTFSTPMPFPIRGAKRLICELSPASI